MRRVVRHRDEFFIPIIATKVFRQQPLLDLRGEYLRVLPPAISIHFQEASMRFVSESMRNELDVFKSQFPGLQAVSNPLGREGVGRLWRLNRSSAAAAITPCGPTNSRRRIEPLHYVVIALRQTLRSARNIEPARLAAERRISCETVGECEYHREILWCNRPRAARFNGRTCETGRALRATGFRFPY